MSASLSSFAPVRKVRRILQDQEPLHYLSLSSFNLLSSEIRCLIADDLSRNDLATCIKVSKGFRYIWGPYLFRDVDLTEEAELMFFQLETIQELFLSHCELTRSFVSYFGLEHGWLLMDAKCSGLRRLNLYFQSFMRSSPKAVFELVDELAWINPDLDRVTLKGQYDWTAALSAFSFCRCLSQLHFDFQEHTLSEVLDPSDADSLEDLSGLLKVRQMSLSGLKGSINRIFVPLCACPGLEAVTIRFVDAWSVSAEFRSKIAMLLKDVECLTWEANEVSERGLDQMLALGAEAKKVIISVPRIHSLKPLVMRAATLRSLTLDGILGSHGAEIQTFLEEATKLEEFCALPSALLENGHLRMRSHHFHDSSEAMQGLAWVLDIDGPTQTWGCSQSLTRLELCIELLYFSFEEDGLFSHESRVEHTAVYQQLGLLVNLQHLRVGQRRALTSVGDGERHGGYHTFCLVFTLESGIGLLGGMKAMRVLDVRWTSHRIDVPELDWFRINWPKLDTIIGLEDLPPGASESCILRSQRAASWAQVHPRGIGQDHHEY